MIPDDFKERLIDHAKLAVSRAERVTSEEAAKQYLVLPFFQLLGYDPLDPDEIIPEAHASFSDKFKNKVDYAICIENKPVVAVECKKTGTLTESNRGELKGYFNAVPTAKLGILTDGLKFEFYSDTGLENMLDDEPFVSIDLTKISKERVSDQALDALEKLHKGTFDPADVGADARRKLFTSKYMDVLEQMFGEPNEEFVKVLMDVACVEGRRTTRLIEEHKPIVADAMQIFFDKKILERVGFANRQDLVKMQQSAPHNEPIPVEPVEVKEPVSLDKGIITTETEIKIYEWVKTRLSFLVKDEETFQKLEDLFYVDYKTLFSVCYKQERKGKLFNFREASGGIYRFEFPGADDMIEIRDGDLTKIDTPLLESFNKRTQDLI